MVGNLFAELEPPCDVPFSQGLTLCGITPAGNRAVLLVNRDFCIFRGEAEDLKAARRGFCPSNAVPAVQAVAQAVGHCRDGAVGQVIDILDALY